MSESKLQRLTKYLIDATYKNKKLANSGEIDCWIEGGRIEPEAEPINSRTRLAATLYYSGSISINPCTTPLPLVAMFVSLWLQGNAETTDSKEAEFSWDLVDDHSAELEITIEQLSDPIYLVKSDTGPFLINDEQWDFGEESAWVAEFLEIVVDIERD